MDLLSALELWISSTLEQGLHDTRPALNVSSMCGIVTQILKCLHPITFCATGNQNTFFVSYSLLQFVSLRQLKGFLKCFLPFKRLIDLLSATG